MEITPTVGQGAAVKLPNGTVIDGYRVTKVSPTGAQVTITNGRDTEAVRRSANGRYYRPVGAFSRGVTEIVFS